MAVGELDGSDEQKGGEINDSLSRILSHVQQTALEHVSLLSSPAEAFPSEAELRQLDKSAIATLFERFEQARVTDTLRGLVLSDAPNAAMALEVLHNFYNHKAVTSHERTANHMYSFELFTTSSSNHITVYKDETEWLKKSTEAKDNYSHLDWLRNFINRNKSISRHAMRLYISTLVCGYPPHEDAVGFLLKVARSEWAMAPEAAAAFSLRKADKYWWHGLISKQRCGQEMREIAKKGTCAQMCALDVLIAIDKEAARELVEEMAESSRESATAAADRLMKYWPDERTKKVLERVAQRAGTSAENAKQLLGRFELTSIVIGDEEKSSNIPTNSVFIPPSTSTSRHFNRHR